MTVRRATFTLLFAATIISSLLQVIIDSSIDNIVCVCLVFGSSLCVLLYISCSAALAFQPLSSFAILGFCFTTQLGALLAQTAAWTALRASLRDPIYTFVTLGEYQIVALAVHIAYCFLFNPQTERNGLLRGWLGRCGLYEIPSSGVLWTMGYIGLSTYILSQASLIQGVAAYEGVPKKIADGFQFLTWAPFIIPFCRSRVANAHRPSRRSNVHILVFGVLIAGLGLGLNIRTVAFMGVATVGLLYFLYALRNELAISWPTCWKLGAFALILLTLAKPLSDLTTAMEIARSHRGKVTALQMIQNTMDVMGRPGLISQYREGQKLQSTHVVYDETYIANPLLNRFVETKFHDNALYFATTITSDESKQSLENVTIERLWALLPDPLLRVLGIQVDKSALLFSSGDYLAFLSRGIPMGSYLTGSLFAHGIALFGQSFLLIYVAICIVAFGVMDILTIESTTGMAHVSIIGMLNCWSFFFRGITSEGLESMVAHYARDLPQTIAIYFIVLALCKSARSVVRRSGVFDIGVWR